MPVVRNSKIADYFSLVKINHTIFSLPFALIGFFLAVNSNHYDLSIRSLVLVLFCVLFARNAAMGFNRYVDREFDKKNPRTALREIPNEVITPGSALLFVIINAVLFIMSSYLLNFLCFLLSPLALLVVLGYSLTKRFTYLSHVFLGLGLALAPIGAYLAVTARFELLPVIYSFIVIFWVAGFDILYALQDIEFDRKEKLKSLPARLGRTKALVLSLLFHLFALILVAAGGIIGGFHLLYWIGAAIFAILLCYEHIIVKPTDISRVNLAFATMNGMASVIFACFLIADLYLR
ncbi:MAG: putative 4-hydroxybenzoate polyprenyltransferase [Bacteroidetes bacterium]|nr:putative 4-hydroxybenzoate polyprenyltransferase [Bacteroidota bacterium]